MLTNERLVELRQFVLSEINYPVGADDTEPTEEGKDLIELIDQAMKPTSEEVRVALTWFEELDTHEFVRRIKEQPDFMATLPDFVVRTALTALRQNIFPLAIQWTGNNLREVIDLIGLNPSANKWTWEEYEQVVNKDGLKIFTPTGSIMANIGDWIVWNGKDCYVAKVRQTQEPCEENTFSQCTECGQFVIDGQGYDYCPYCKEPLQKGGTT